MAYRTVLVPTGTDGGDEDIRAAAALCQDAGAHLSVLALALSMTPPMGEYAAISAEAWLEDRREAERSLGTRLDGVRALLAQTGVSADIAGEIIEPASADAVIGRRARYADLTYVGAGLPADQPLRERVIEGALFESGRGVLLVPAGAKATLAPRRVVVGWDSGPEAARAAREALDMLATADEVRLMLVDPVEGEFGQGAEPGADMAAFLARHGARVSVDRLPSGGRAVASVLARHATDVAADLLVMGGYGHSRLRERIFGGVTRSILDDLPLPVFMAR